MSTADVMVILEATYTIQWDTIWLGPSRTICDTFILCSGFKRGFRPPDRQFVRPAILSSL